MDLNSDLLEHVEQHIFVLEPDPNGAPVFAAISAHACRAMGMPLEAIIGRTARDLFPGRLGQYAFDHHLKALRSGTPVDYGITLPIGGTQKRLRTSLRPSCDHDGNVVRIIGSSVELSMSGILPQHKANKESINVETQDFITLAAHDLRTPMRNVLHITEMLREDFDDLGDGKLELVDLLENIGLKASHFIDDILSHALATSAVPHVSVFDFGALVSKIAVLLDPMQDHQITYPSAQIEGDRTTFQIVLRNLLDNAIKNNHQSPSARAAGQARSTLEIDLQLTDTGDDFLEVTVTDNGIGFSDAALEFLKGGKLRVDSGFGLLGVRHLLEARGGRLIVSNRVDGKGAAVAFTLPGTTVAHQKNDGIKVA